MSANDSFVKCKCGCELFVESLPKAYKSSLFQVHSSQTVIANDKNSIPVITCIRCGRIDIPNASFTGKNILDPEVETYALLLGYIREHNAIIEKKEAVNVQATK